MREWSRIIYAFVALTFVPLCSAAQIQDSTRTNTASSTGGIFKVGNGVSAPRAIYAPDPAYPEEARKEQVEGVCVLWLIVSSDETTRNIRIMGKVGYGFDEKAVETVGQWKFEPGIKDGKPVAVQINVKVSFRLFNSNKKIRELWERADADDAKAELELSQAYFQGRDVNKSESWGYELLERSANHGLSEAQFKMGEYRSDDGFRPHNYVDAYMWYSLARRSGYKDSDKKLKDLAAKMSPENVAEADARAQNWQPSK